MHIIKNISCALHDFREIREEYGCVTLKNIVIRSKAMLKDNMLVREEERD